MPGVIKTTPRFNVVRTTNWDYHNDCAGAVSADLGGANTAYAVFGLLLGAGHQPGWLEVVTDHLGQRYPTLAN